MQNDSRLMCTYGKKITISEIRAAVRHTDACFLSLDFWWEITIVHPFENQDVDLFILFCKVVKWNENNDNKNTELQTYITYVSPTLELSSVAKGFSPPLQISHSVVPKLHLSAARLRLAESSIHSGGTQGILSIRTYHKQKHLTHHCKYLIFCYLILCLNWMHFLLYFTQLHI